MSSRVQKGSTVFRPISKARSRPVDGTVTQSSASQDRHAAPQPEGRKTPSPEDPPSAIVRSTAVQQDTLHGFDYTAAPAVTNTTRQGIPIIVSSSISLAQQATSRPPLPAIVPAGSSHAKTPIAEQPPLERSAGSLRSDSFATPKKSKKVRRRTTPAFDRDVGPGEDLDPTSVTMAALCEDTGQGRVSSKAAQILGNHLAWKKSSKEKRAKMRVKMEAKKYGGSEEGETAQATRQEGESEQMIADVTPASQSVQPVSGNIPCAADTSGQGFDYSQNVSTSRYNVQVRIGPNGETIVDEESLFVDRTAEEDTTEYIHVEESDVTKFVNSATYSKRFRGSRWSTEETELFYDALSQFGENYELISYVLPGRDRKACKNKFKSEDKKNSQRINYCLNNRKPYDMQKLSRMTGKDFSGPIPEIRAPAVMSLAESTANHDGDEYLGPEQTVHSSSSVVKGFDPDIGPG